MFILLSMLTAFSLISTILLSSPKHISKSSSNNTISTILIKIPQIISPALKYAKQNLPYLLHAVPSRVPSCHKMPSSKIHSFPFQHFSFTFDINIRYALVYTENKNPRMAGATFSLSYVDQISIYYRKDFSMIKALCQFFLLCSDKFFR